MDSYGRLILTLPDGDEHVYELVKDTLTLGRHAENDISLRDTRVSRNHARLDQGQEGVFLTDLGSANGTLVNAARVQRVRLNPGDLIRLGDSTLRFEATMPAEAPDLTVIDSAEELDRTLASDTVAMTVYDTSQPRLVVHTDDLTWEVRLQADRYLIGRGLETDIHIPHARISRDHARIERQGQDFVIHDLGSANGTWVAGQPVSSHRLADGDIVQLGNARLVYKSPYTSNDLTLVDEPVGDTKPRKPVIVVPGFMGSQLGRGGEMLWPNVTTLFSNPEIFKLPESGPMDVHGIVEDVVVVPNLIKMEQYRRLGDYLVDGLGYTRGVDLIEFGYDWRFSVRQAARSLGRLIEGWDVSGPITLIGHSLGTLVSRYYVEKLGGRRAVDRLILMGGPHSGVPRALAGLLVRADLLPFGVMGDRIREVLVTFPSAYEILPVYPCVRDQNGVRINVLEDESWLPEEFQGHLRSARHFRKELGNRSSVPALSIFGYGNKTLMNFEVERRSDGSWRSISPDSLEQGDDTIPEFSAILEGSDIHPVQQYHASLYIDSDVKMRLKVELTRPYD